MHPEAFTQHTALGNCHFVLKLLPGEKNTEPCLRMIGFLEMGGSTNLYPGNIINFCYKKIIFILLQNSYKKQT